MEPERLEQIERLFHAALEMECARRAEFLNQACGGDEALRLEVESLLTYRTRAREFIEQPAMEVAAHQMVRTPGAPSEFSQEVPRWMPASIGRYRILRVLGEGGMGVVYEAEQDQPRRAVALKVIKPGMATHELLRRFEQESRALARLQHPAIAQIHEAGTADAGFGPQPYFALELIRGRPLLEYVEENQLATRQRLQLMIKICEGVEHAHQRGLIHRDLKPGNILVDEIGQPKILDFGVARATDGDVQATQLTDRGQMVGTLAYMSPEQVLADPLELDTRSDVYALGVILYELLAGRLPYELSGKAHEAARVIREEDPIPLSTVSRFYRGDIETIALKALEKEKSRRYASAAALAADLQRYLDDEPIAARPASTAYQVRKFARRHRALVGAVAAVSVVLVAGTVVSTREALHANSEAATARAVNDFLQNDLLAQAGASAQSAPNRKPDPNLTVRTALDRAAARIEGKFRSLPLVEASIRETIATAYRDLGLFAEAERHLGRTVELRRRVLGEGHAETLKSSASLADLYFLETRYGQAEALLAKVLSAERHVLGEKHRNTLGTANDLAVVYVYEGKYAPAEQLYTRVLEMRRRVLGDEHTDTLETLNNLAQLYRRQGEYERAEPLLTMVADAEANKLGEEHPNHLGTMNNLATLYQEEGKYALAEHLFTKVLEARRRVLGPEHTATLVSMNNLALLYHQQGKYALAEPIYTRVFEVRQRLEGDDHPATLVTLNNLALLYDQEGKDALAERLYLQVIQARRRVLGENADTLKSVGGLAALYLRHSKYADAERWLREALAGYATSALDIWQRYDCQSMLGASLAGRKRYAEAESPLIAGYTGMLQREANIPAAYRTELVKAGQRIVQLYRDWGKPEQTAEWLRKLSSKPS